MFAAVWEVHAAHVMATGREAVVVVLVVSAVPVMETEALEDLVIGR